MVAVTTITLVCVVIAGILFISGIWIDWCDINNGDELCLGFMSGAATFAIISFVLAGFLLHWLCFLLTGLFFWGSTGWFVAVELWRKRQKRQKKLKCKMEEQEQQRQQEEKMRRRYREIERETEPDSIWYDDFS